MQEGLVDLSDASAVRRVRELNDVKVSGQKLQKRLRTKSLKLSPMTTGGQRSSK